LENGGLFVFIYEFGYDFGLLDYYDMVGGDNGVEYWMLMA